jgi:ribose transport system substrate-binding protein
MTDVTAPARFEECGAAWRDQKASISTMKLRIKPLSGSTAILALVMAATVSLAAACSSTPASSSSSSSGQSSSAKSYSVAFVAEAPDNSFTNSIYHSMQQVSAKYHMTVSYNQPAAFDATDQTNTLNAVLATRPSLLVLDPVDPTAVRPAVQRFISAGIPVVLVDSQLADMSGIVSSIAGDGAQAGQIAADAVGKALGGKGDVIVVNIEPGVPSLTARVNGFVAEMKSKFPGITIVANTNGGATPSSNETEIRSLLIAYPHINAIFGTTEVEAEGAAPALAAAHKTASVYVAAVDATPEEVQYLKTGKVDFLAAQNPDLEGTMALEYGYDYLTGDKSAIQASVSIPATGVAQANVSSPSIAPYLYLGGAQ